MINPYTEEYYRTSNYSDYAERGERYYKLARETTNLLDQLGLVNKDSFITDFGCATGHLLTGLKELGYQDVDGVEISEWARKECSGKRLHVFSSLDDWKTDSIFASDVVYALDVLEHMNDEDAAKFFEKTRKDHCLIVRIPVASVAGNPFHLEVSRKDPTHINCKTARGWEHFIREHRYYSSRILRLNLSTIYDSKGVFSALVI